MKTTHHIATGQFEFLEIEQEAETQEQAVEAHNSLKTAFIATQTAGVGLDAKEWNKTLDGYLTVGEMLGDAYQRMSPEQQRVVQEIKKSINRVNPREKRD